MKLNDISIKAKLFSILAFFVVAFFAFLATYYITSRETKKNIALVFDDSKIVDLIWLSNASLEELVISSHNYLTNFSQEEKANFNRISQEARENFDKLKLEMVKHISHSPNEAEKHQKEMNNADTIFHEMMLLGGQIFENLDSSNTKDILVKLDQLDALALRAKSEMAELHQSAYMDVYGAEAEMIDLQKQSNRAIVITVVFMIIVALILEIFVRYFIMGKVNKLIVGANEFSRGNLDYIIDDGSDELGKLATILNGMAGKIKMSQTELVQQDAKDKSLHELLRKLGASIEMDSIMRAIADTVREIFPRVTVSYVMAPIIAKATPRIVYVRTPYEVGEQYLEEVKESILLGLDTLPTLKIVAPLFEKWRSLGFDTILTEGEKSLMSEEIPRSSINIPLIIPQSIAGIFNFSSDREGVFGEAEIEMLYEIVSYASETVERIRHLVDNEEQRLANLIESIGDGVVVIDRNWNITLLNKAATKISGYSQEEVMGRSFRDIMKLLRERDRKEDVAFIEKAMVEKTTQSIAEPMVLVAKGGREVPLGDSAAPFVDQSGEVVGAIIVFRDTTKEREVQGLRSDFAYASHQLRTPINKAMWNLEAALRIEDVAKLQNAMRVAYDSMRSVQKLSEELLEVSRIDKGEVSAEKEHMLVSDGIVEAVRKTKNLAEYARIDLVQGLNEETGVTTNKKLLVNTLVMILENAIIYNRQGGRVEIKVRRQNGDALIEITDTGVGIIEEERPFVFTKFFRGSNFDTTAIPGAGLGLYIARAYVTLLDGKIWFESTEKEGTTFFVLLPTG